MCRSLLNALVLVIAVAALAAGAAGAATNVQVGGDCVTAPLEVVCRLGTGDTTPGGAANHKVSHQGWPAVDGVYWVMGDQGGGGVATDRNDELMGQHANDHLDGAAGNDIIWGDELPTGNNSWQKDVLIGGTGDDFLYSSHGHNRIDAGPGNDIIHVHFGRGTLDCGPGDDLVYLSHKRRHNWKLKGCEQKTFHTGLVALTPRG